MNPCNASTKTFGAFLFTIAFIVGCQNRPTEDPRKPIDQSQEVKRAKTMVSYLNQLHWDQLTKVTVP